MKFGLQFTNANKEEDWIRESDQSISIWETPEEAYIKPLKRTSKPESQPGLFDNE